MDMCRPLVTIGVITYNSAGTIVETLESVKKQTYGNIELIISDDASKDNTVEICRDWLERNASRFSRVEIITTDVNTGTCGNCDRLLEKTTGLWLRILAADDILFGAAVEKFIEYAAANPEAQWIFSKAHCYKHSFEKDNYLPGGDRHYLSSEFLDFFTLSAREQYLKFIHINLLYPPADIVRTDALRIIGGFEAKYGLNEDIVKDIKLSKAGIKCHFLDDYTMGYRIGESNVCSNTTRLFNLKSLEDVLSLQKGLCWDDTPRNLRVYFKMRLFSSRITQSLGMNRANRIFWFVYYGKLKIYKIILRIK